MRVLKGLVLIASAVLLLGLLAAGGALALLWHYGRDLPDYRQLADYQPPVMSRVHAADGSLIAEYAQERRLFVPIAAIPKRVKQAFLSAEDKTFYSHPGIDIFGIAHAALINLKNLGTDRRPIGASTITQQVAKNFLLSNEVSLERKIKEAILAFRIEQALSKDRILELYLNEIYLGFASYGVAAASLNYFNKPLDELTLAEAAFLAALPKAPNNYHPIRRHEAAVARRNWVLYRMVDDGYITAEEAAAAQAEPLVVHAPDPTRFVDAEYFAEEVRRELLARYGEKRLYEGGLSVRTTLEPRLQRIAEHALRHGLVAYDHRHGYRGPLARIELDGAWQPALAAARLPAALPAEWDAAVVLALQADRATIGFADGSKGVILLSDLEWARPVDPDDESNIGPVPAHPRDIFAMGDVIAVLPLRDKTVDGVQAYALRQIPEVNGAIVAMDPHTGRVLAMVGGFSYAGSQFNRATQAMRQPGSAFKPFVYAAALDNGFTPSSLILDAPFVLDQGPTLGKWKPSNYSERFYGLSTLRLGIEKSRNLMTVRLAQEIGMDKVVDYAKRFGIVDDMPPLLPMALGAGETTLLRLTTGYAMLVNGGKRITPTLIDRIQDRRGATIYKHDKRPCPGCIAASWHGQPVPVIPDEREQVISSATAYQVVSLLQGVVERGTGRSVSVVGKPLAGKTGTTNESRDTWFVGFSPDLAVGVFVGFDVPRSLGAHETGSSVSAPIFRDFMAAALENQPAIPFRIPPDIRLVRVNARTGARAMPGDTRVILEAFKPGTEPALEPQPVGGGTDAGPAVGITPRVGTGGLY